MYLLTDDLLTVCLCSKLSSETSGAEFQSLHLFSMLLQYPETYFSFSVHRVVNSIISSVYKGMNEEIQENYLATLCLFCIQHPLNKYYFSPVRKYKSSKAFLNSKNNSPMKIPEPLRLGDLSRQRDTTVCICSAFQELMEFIMSRKLQRLASLCVRWDVPFRHKLLSFLTIFHRLQKSKAVIVYLKCPEELDIEGIGVFKRPQGLGQPFM